MKQPDLRAGRTGRPGELIARREEYRAFRKRIKGCAWRADKEPKEIQSEIMSADNAARFNWVSTPTAERITAGLRYAQFTQDIVIVYGGAGLGKSHCLQRYLSMTPAVFLISLTPASGGIATSLQEICRALKVEANYRRPVQMHRAICAKLKNSSALLMFDEAQELNMQALDQVRCIHDHTKVGIALVGNEQVYTRISGANRPAYLDRLYSRIGKRIHLPRALPDDIAAITDALGIHDPQARARLGQIGARPGALRALQKVARLAGVYAASEGRTLCLEDVENAWTDLGGIG